MQFNSWDEQNVQFPFSVLGFSMTPELFTVDPHFLQWILHSQKKFTPYKVSYSPYNRLMNASAELGEISQYMKQMQVFESISANNSVFNFMAECIEGSPVICALYTLASKESEPFQVPFLDWRNSLVLWQKHPRS